MIKKVLGLLWRRTPRRLRRWGAHLSQQHFTVSAAAIVLDEQERLLLLKHVFRGGEGWGVPGGFISSGEQPDAAVMRELREETGLEIERAELAFVRTLEHVNHVEMVFRCRARSVDAKAQSLEISELKWCAPDRLPEGLGRDQRYIIKRALEDRANE
jgi:8-oxo-dGTP diphosphatase